MRESISRLSILLKEKAVQVEDTRAVVVYQALQQVLEKQNVRFCSIEQEQTLYAVLDKITPLVVMLLTEEGKSLLFTLLAYIEETRVIVVIILYQALIKDLVNQIRNYSINYIEQKHSKNNLASVVVISADVAGDIISNSNFLEYTQLIKDKRLLQQVVVDKCYLLFTAQHQRANLLKVKNLRLLRYLIVLLTVTLPLVQKRELEVSMLVRNATYIQASTA